MVCPEFRLWRHLHPTHSRPRRNGTRRRFASSTAQHRPRESGSLLQGQQHLQKHPFHSGIRLSPGEVQQRAGSAVHDGLQRSHRTEIPTFRWYDGENAARLCQIHRRNHRARLPESPSRANDRLSRTRHLFLHGPDGRPQPAKQLHVCMARRDAGRHPNDGQARADDTTHQLHAGNVALHDGLCRRQPIPSQGRIQRRRILRGTHQPVHRELRGDFGGFAHPNQPARH